MPQRIRRNISHRLRRFLVLSISVAGLLAEAVRLGAAATLQFAFKAPEDVTVKQFPRHPRYGPRAGDDNSSFLDAALFQSAFLDLLAPYQPRVATLIFEFGSFAKQCYPDVARISSGTGPLSGGAAAQASATPSRSAIPNFFRPSISPACARHRVAHVFNAWTRMPEIGARCTCAMPTPPISRWLARCCGEAGAYEEAVAKFTPYARVQDPNPETRDALRLLIARARDATSRRTSSSTTGWRATRPKPSKRSRMIGR